MGDGCGWREKFLGKLLFRFVFSYGGMENLEWNGLDGWQRRGHPVAVALHSGCFGVLLAFA